MVKEMGTHLPPRRGPLFTFWEIQRPVLETAIARLIPQYQSTLLAYLSLFSDDCECLVAPTSLQVSL